MCHQFSGTCDYQLFDKNYALFVYPGFGNSFTLRDPLFTEWINHGGMAVYGAPLGPEATATSISGVPATQQLFANGAIFSYPPAGKTPSTFSIAQPFYAAFNTVSGLFQLGLPTSDPLPLASGLVRQTFEEGRIEVMPDNHRLSCFRYSSYQSLASRRVSTWRLAHPLRSRPLWKTPQTMSLLDGLSPGPHRTDRLPASSATEIRQR